MPRKKVNDADKSLPANKQKGNKKCNYCHENKKVTDFYISKNPLHSADERVPICKDCIAECSLNEDGTINEIEFNKILKLIDRPYYKDMIESSIESFKKEHSYIEDDKVKFYGKEIIQKYFTIIAMRQDRDKSYEDSVKDGFIHQNNNTPKSTKEKIAKKYADITEAEKITALSSDITDQNTIHNTVHNIDNKNISWSEQDIKNMEYAVEVVGYDPFEDYPEENRRFLFNSLSPYLEDDDNVDDAYKLSQIIQIVDNNNQIRICNKRIANLDAVKDYEEIKTLQEIKKNLVQSNDKIAKENEISVKNRSNKDAGKSTLTYLMRDLRERNFDKAEADYYDQLRSEGTQWAISISQKAMLDHCIFDENDKKEIYETQLKLIDGLYKELDDKKEEVRQLLMKIDTLNLELYNIKQQYGIP